VSSFKCTKHIKEKYFFIHHFHNSGENWIFNIVPLNKCGQIF
jgi:hypothetical protein